MAQLGEAGAALTALAQSAHEALRAALGEAGFPALDSYVSAATAVACAREEALVTLLVAVVTASAQRP